MQEEFACTIHKVAFGISWPNKKPDDFHLHCPLCRDSELRDLRQQISELKSHRDLLISCIDLKRTLVRMNTNEEAGDGGG